MKGKLRVVVATVAFGMGIDKHDVRGVIHFNCPNSIEAYVQEAGRAGRDGRNAYCHLFFDDHDLARLRNYAFAEGVDGANVKVLVEALLLTSSGEQRRAGTFAALPLDDEKKYDMSKESVAAVLSFLEQEGVVATLNDSYAEGVLSFIKDNMLDLQSTSQVVDAILKTERAINGQWKFSPADIASHIGRPPRQVMRVIPAPRGAPFWRYALLRCNSRIVNGI
jgi:superfamily II DNA helicase RecQ